MRLGSISRSGESSVRRRPPFFRYPRVTLGSQGDPALTRGYNISPTSWLSSVHNEEVNGGDGYYRQQTTTDNYSRSTFDSHRSTQRIDGTGDTHYQGNRTLSGNGWMSHWTLRQFEEFEPEQGSHHMPLVPEDDRPNSYDVTIDSSSEASADTPIAYGYSTNPPVNTPPAVATGPGGFSPPEDPTEISGLQGQVAMNGSAAASNNAARDAAFAELAEETESSDEPGDESTTETPSAASVASTYVEGQGSVPTNLRGQA